MRALSVLIEIGIIFMLIRLSFLSTWYVLDIYLHWYDSNFHPCEYVLDIYQVDTTPISIHVNTFFGYLSSWYNSNFYQLDITPILFMEICFKYLSTLIRLQIQSTWYVLDIYQVDICWIFIKLIYVGYLSSWYNSNFYQLDMSWIFIKLIQLQIQSTWYVLDIYQLDMCWISIKLI